MADGDVALLEACAELGAAGAKMTSTDFTGPLDSTRLRGHARPIGCTYTPSTCNSTPPSEGTDHLQKDTRRPLSV